MSNLQTKFDQYHNENPQVYDKFKETSFQAIVNGYKNTSSDFILHIVRWETNVGGNDIFKINNNYSAFYGRLFMKDHPEHTGFFRTRKSAADN